MIKINVFRSAFLRRRALFCALTLASVCLAAGCRKAPEKIDLESSQSSAAETLASETEEEKEVISLNETTAAEESTAETTAGDGIPNSKNISTTLNTYSSGQVTIRYPSVTNMDDPNKAEAIDALIKKNALAVLDAYEIKDSEDTLKAECQVLAADRNRITILYTGSLTKKGAPYPTNLFYTNTIDVGNVSDIGFSRYADPYTMAGYVLSGDCRFAGGSENTSALLEARKDYTLEQYTEMFTNADFPINEEFPQSFSYEHQGIVYFSIPMPHALGDYAVVMFSPESK